MNPAFKWAMRLFFAKGWDTGSHESYGTVLYREQRIWQIKFTGYKRSTRDAYLQRLGTRKLVKVEHDGIRLSEELVG